VSAAAAGAADRATYRLRRDAAYPLSRAWYERFWSVSSDEDDPDEQHDPALMTSIETGRMILELQRYCRGERDGVSILVAGQRGAGKTTLVKMAIQEVMRANSGLIPLPIFLHGPTIIDPTASTSPPNARISALGVQITPAAKDENAANVEDSKWSKELALPQIINVLYRDVSRMIYRAWLNALQVSPYGRRAERELLELRTHLDLSLDSAPDAVTLRKIWARAGFLHSGVAPYLVPLPRNGGQPPPVAGHRDDQGLREILALVSCADAYRVVLGDTKERQQRASSDKQQSATLPAPSPPREAAPKSADPKSAGPKSGEDAKQKSTTEKLAPTALAAVTGGLALFSGQNRPPTQLGPLAFAVAVAAVVWLATWLATSYGTQRQSRQEVRRNRTTDIKWDVARIERDFPKLLKRVKDAGFAPIFVLDELDKMKNAKKKLEDFLLLSKHMVTDDAAFLFLTNRSYYESLITNEQRTIDELLGDKPERRSNGAAASRSNGAASRSNGRANQPNGGAGRPNGGNSNNLRAKTFFTYRIFVRYSPDDFRQFLLDSINDDDWPNDESEIDSQRQTNRLGLLAWGTILIYRSRMLPVDFDRRFKLMIDPDGTFNKDPQSPFGTSGLRQELTMQLGIELIAREPAVRERMTELPYFSQYVYDALYFVADLHAMGRSKSETNDPFRITPELLRKYLWMRAQGEEEEPMPKSFIPPDDADFLFSLVQRYIQLLENPRLIREGTLRYADSDEVPEADKPLWERLAHAINEWPIVEVKSRA